MECGTVLSVVQAMFAALRCTELKELCSMLGYKWQLEDLQRTINTVKAVLCDAQAKQEMSLEAQLWLQELKDAVYDADDLLDEFVTLAEQKRLNEGEKVRCFFSRFYPFGLSYKMSQGVKKIRKKLDAIAKNHSQFGFSVDYQAIRRRREETCSYVFEGSIVGREDDVEKIVGIMLKECNTRSQEDISFLTIVGIGGVGKTAVAQLVYNDARVRSEFALRLWTCVADHDHQQLDIQGILSKILASVTGEQHEGRTNDWVQGQLCQQITCNKFLLVLDDVWTENRNQWLRLVDFFSGCQNGSWIVITTRSHETARIAGGGPKYELQGLSIDNSWHLFKKTAFDLKQFNPQDELVMIGREIVNRCSGVPLAIRVAGSLLYGQHKSKWLLFKEFGLSNFRESKKDIMPILELSYHQLESPLKSCFTYCAMFPKDFEIEKKKLIGLWMAQGYIVPLDDGQRIEDAADEYFSILLRRCFFQDVKCDQYGEIYSCKMHDLMHDIAQKVAGKEICVAKSITDNFDKKVRHLACIRSESAQKSFTKTHLRTYLCVCNSYYRDEIMDQHSLEELLANWVYLRALDLSRLNIKSLPSSIGELLHLRYLDLSGKRDLEILPKSIIKLYNLQTLKLSWCLRLKELPKDLSKLVKLRVLDIKGCDMLTCMPRSIAKLTCLHTLTDFVVHEARSNWKQWFNQLEELRDLHSLKGELCVNIKFPENATKVEEGGRREGAYLRGKEHLDYIIMKCDGITNDEKVMSLIMEELQPHPNLKGLELEGYHGVKMPGWAGENNLVTCLPNLTRLTLMSIKVEFLTCLGNLPCLKFLSLNGLDNLEYMIESGEHSSKITEILGEGLSFFPCLEKLELWDLPKLKGWRWISSMVVRGCDQLLQIDNSKNYNMTALLLSQLKTLDINECPHLRVILQCPRLKELRLERFNKSLQIKTIVIKGKCGDESSCKTPSFCCKPPPTPKLREVHIDNIVWLNSLPIEAFQCLDSLDIGEDEAIESLEEVEEVFRSCSSSLRSLHIQRCPKMRSVVCGGLEHLSAMVSLSIQYCPNISLSEDETKKGKPWEPVNHCLRSLTLKDLPMLLAVPYWIQYTSNLQTLEIALCDRIQSLPHWLSKITSLRKLLLCGCSARLEERCRPYTGKDWPHIQHIPSISFEYL